MPQSAVSREVDFTADQLLALVEDVESYPDFVPGWAAARVIRRHRDGYETEQVVKVKAFRHRFRSRTYVDRANGEVRVVSDEPPLRHLRMLWSIRPVGGGGTCRIELDVDFELKDWRFDLLAGVLFGPGVDRLVEAFVHRAETLFGHPAHISGGPGARPPHPSPP